jgi:hypothetical protein
MHTIPPSLSLDVSQHVGYHRQRHQRLRWNLQRVMAQSCPWAAGCIDQGISLNYLALLCFQMEVFAVLCSFSRELLKELVQLGRLVTPLYQFNLT